MKLIIYSVLIVLTLTSCSSSKNANNRTISKSENSKPLITFSDINAEIEMLSANNDYVKSVNNCYVTEFKNNKFNKFVKENVLISDLNVSNRDQLLKSKKLLDKSEWATYSWFWTDVNSCINDLGQKLNRLPYKLRNVYIERNKIENLLTEELRLRKINVGLYNQTKLYLQIETIEKTDTIFKEYREKSDAEKSANNSLIETDRSKAISTSNERLTNSAIATAICSAFAKGNAAGCAAGALDTDGQSASSNDRRRQRDIDSLKNQQRVDKANQDLKDAERDYEKRRDELMKFKTGNTGLR